MNFKKLLCLLLAIIMFAFSLSSCEALSSDRENHKSNTKDEDDDNKKDKGKENTSSSVNNDAIAAIYKKYTNLVGIGPFYNGLAYFKIKVSTYDYRYGYIDIKGNIIIEPEYIADDNSYNDAKNFEYDHVKLELYDTQSPDCIVDKQGNIKFKVGRDNVSAVGDVSNGYFWVETVEELVTGNVYTVTYYSAKDLSAVATFNNQRAIHDGYNYASDSAINNMGEATLGDYKTTFNIANYDSSFVPTPDNWNIDIREIDYFSTARNITYKISGTDNDLGQLATVAVKNQNGVNFFAVMDSTGSFVFQPQQKISFITSDHYNVYNENISNAEFRKNLCPAKDVESELWGYVDSYGNWKIQPQYSSAAPFSPDGYATVNKSEIIDTQGNIVLSPYTSTTEFTYGRYTYRDNAASWSMIFDESGKLTINKYTSYGYTDTATSKYEIKGNVLVIYSKIPIYMPSCPGIGTDAGEFIFTKGDSVLNINGVQWTFSDT